MKNKVVVLGAGGQWKFFLFKKGLWNIKQAKWLVFSQEKRKDWIKDLFRHLCSWLWCHGVWWSSGARRWWKYFVHAQSPINSRCAPMHDIVYGSYPFCGSSDVDYGSNFQILKFWLCFLDAWWFLHSCSKFFKLDLN